MKIVKLLALSLVTLVASISNANIIQIKNSSGHPIYLELSFNDSLNSRVQMKLENNQITPDLAKNLKVSEITAQYTEGYYLKSPAYAQFLAPKYQLLNAIKLQLLEHDQDKPIVIILTPREPGFHVVSHSDSKLNTNRVGYVDSLNKLINNTDSNNTISLKNNTQQTINIELCLNDEYKSVLTQTLSHNQTSIPFNLVSLKLHTIKGQYAEGYITKSSIYASYIAPKYDLLCNIYAKLREIGADKKLVILSAAKLLGFNISSEKLEQSSSSTSSNSDNSSNSNLNQTDVVITDINQ